MQYAMLQAYWPRHSRDLLIHTVELHMARNDMRPCSREEAERTVALVPNSSGWAVYDDCADRMDLSAMDGLGRALTRRLEKSGASGTVALGVVVSEEKRLLRLYAGGRVRDTLLLSPHPNEATRRFLPVKRPHRQAT